MSENRDPEKNIRNPGQVKLIAGRIICVVGLICVLAGIVAAFTGVMTPSISAGVVGLLLGVWGYFLGARRLGTATVIIAVAAISFELVAGGGLIPGIEQPDTGPSDE